MYGAVEPTGSGNGRRNLSPGVTPIPTLGLAQVAGIVAPVFGLIAFGAAARWRRLLDAGGQRGLNDLTFYLLIPALLFGSVAEGPEFVGLGTAAAYFACCLAVFAAGVVIGRRLLGTGIAAASVLGLNCAYGNTIMLGVPVVSAAFGPTGVQLLLPIVALHTIVLLPLATVLIEAESAPQGAGPRLAGIAGGLIRNPIVAGILAGIIWRMLGIPVPAPLHRLLAMLGAAAPTLALFSLGASLPDFAARGSARETGVALVLKLLVLPGLVWAVVRIIGLDPLPAAVAIVTAAAPTGANAFFLARRMGTLAAASAGMVVASTVLSVLTLSLFLAIAL